MCILGGLSLSIPWCPTGAQSSAGSVQSNYGSYQGGYPIISPGIIVASSSSYSRDVPMQETSAGHQSYGEPSVYMQTDAIVPPNVSGETDIPEIFRNYVPYPMSYSNFDSSQSGGMQFSEQPQQFRESTRMNSQFGESQTMNSQFGESLTMNHQYGDSPMINLQIGEFSTMNHPTYETNFSSAVGSAHEFVGNGNYYASEEIMSNQTAADMASEPIMENRQDFSGVYESRPGLERSENVVLYKIIDNDKDVNCMIECNSRQQKSGQQNSGQQIELKEEKMTSVQSASGSPWVTECLVEQDTTTRDSFLEVNSSNLKSPSPPVSLEAEVVDLVNEMCQEVVDIVNDMGEKDTTETICLTSSVHRHEEASANLGCSESVDVVVVTPYEQN